MKKIIKIREFQLNNIIKNVINEGWVRGMDWYDPEHNDAFDDITDEKIIEVFEEYGLCADKKNVIIVT